MSDRPRVLIVAEAANPEWASVPLVGWSLARALFDVVDAHLITQVRNRDALARAGWREGDEFSAIDSEAVARPVWRFGQCLRATGLGWTTSTALSSLPYYWFEHLVWRRFGDAIRAHRFEIVHRITPLSPTVPSLLAHRCREAGVPFVWGPLNGGVAWPSEFGLVRRQEGEWLSYLRSAHRLMPGYLGSRREAAAILIGSRATWEQFGGYHSRCVYVPENGIDAPRFRRGARPPVTLPLRVAFVGRLVPYKGADMLVEACAPLVRAGLVRLDILGDGPQMLALQRQIARANTGEGVRLHGWVPHRDVPERLAACDVLAFPSVREFGGGVVLEAMALGLVPVVVDYAGPAELVTDATGYRVPIGPRAAVVRRFHEVLERLAMERSRVRPMGERASSRAHTLFAWPAKAAQVLEVYRWVLGERDRPSFGMPFPDPTAAAAAATGGPGS
jgi:glycosyltransferase involved in cell wall biosynthesis